MVLRVSFGTVQKHLVVSEALRKVMDTVFRLQTFTSGNHKGRPHGLPQHIGPQMYGEKCWWGKDLGLLPS